MSRVVHILGPTASGKSALAERAAERFDAEIVSVDSALVYRGMDIGTAKPEPAIRAQIQHWLIDICEPEESYSAARFVSDANAALDAIAARGKRAILVGGTMLYFRSLCDGLSDLPESQNEERHALSQEWLARGAEAMHAELAAFDPVAAGRIRVNDRQRVLRALEVIRVTGRTLSELQTRQHQPKAPIAALRLAYAPSDRSVLHERIARRLQLMFDGGLVDEVIGLRARPQLTADHPSMRAVGYRQVWEYLDGHCSEAEMRLRALYATRQLAKRQFTWLRSERQLQWVDSLSAASEALALEAMDMHFNAR